jgi:hypothetical protein
MFFSGDCSAAFAALGQPEKIKQVFIIFDFAAFQFDYFLTFIKKYLAY